MTPRPSRPHVPACLALACVALLLVAPRAAAADPADGRTPIDSLPYVISEPGAYVLATTLFGDPVATADAIRIQADGVTLDLDGQALVGGPSTNQNAISCGTQKAIVIRNGFLTAWSGFGILSQTGSRDITVEDVTVQGCAAGGVVLRGANNRVRRVTILDGGQGLEVAGRSHAEDVLVMGTAGAPVFCSGADGELNDVTVVSDGPSPAVHIGDRWRADGLVVDAAAVQGLTGVDAFLDCVLTDVQVSVDEGIGIALGLGGTALRCIVRNLPSSTIGGSIGIDADSRVTLRDCRALDFTNGLVTLGGSTIADCDVVGGFAGIQAGADSHVERCLVDSASGVGIVATGSRVSTCLVSGSGAGFIVADSEVTGCRSQDGAEGFFGSGSTFTECAADGHVGSGFTQDMAPCVFLRCSMRDGTTGLLATGPVTVDDCFATGNSVGFNLNGGGGVFVRNVAMGNGLDFDIAAGNDTGPMSTAFTQTSPAGNVP